METRENLPFKRPGAMPGLIKEKHPVSSLFLFPLIVFLLITFSSKAQKSVGDVETPAGEIIVRHGKHYLVGFAGTSSAGEIQIRNLDADFSLINSFNVPGAYDIADPDDIRKKRSNNGQFIGSAEAREIDGKRVAFRQDMGENTRSGEAGYGLYVFEDRPGMVSHHKGGFPKNVVYRWKPDQQITFAPPKEISHGKVQGISALVAADFNGDTLKDIVVFSGKKPGKNIVFEWYRQKGNEWIRHELDNYGIFGKADTDFIGSAQACDFDDDGKMDFVFTLDGHKTGPIKVYLWENPGHGKCTRRSWPHHLIASVTGVHANDMRLGDMDGDGKTDIVIRHKEPDDVKILFQNNLMNWEVKSAVHGYEGEGLALGDLNADGKTDIAFTGYWFKSPDNPRLEEYSTFIIDESFHPTNPASKDEIGDINRDGRNDVVISPAESFPNYGGENYVLAWYECPENPESGTWTQHIIKSDYNDGHFIRLADFDSDGNIDIISGRAWNNVDLRLYLNENSKFKKEITIAEGIGGYSGAVCDMDNDGDIDIVIEDSYSGKNKPWFFENKIPQLSTMGN